MQLNIVKYTTLLMTLMNFQASIKTINKQIMNLKTYQIDLMLTKLLIMSVKINLLCLVHLKKQLNHKLRIKLHGKTFY